MTPCEATSEGLAILGEAARSQTLRSVHISQHYSVERTPFARGKFAAVRKCRHLVNGGEFAAKFIRRSSLRPITSPANRSGGGTSTKVGGVSGSVGGVSGGMGVASLIEHEIAILQLAREAAERGSSAADRLVTLHEAFVTPTEAVLVLEMMGGGDLQQVVDAEDCLDETRARYVLTRTVEGLSFLHSQRIAHLDLKPQNILLSGALPDCTVKICDFGISRVVSQGVEVREILGTPDYVAPEVLQFEPVSLATDMWSVGVLTYVLLSGHSPFAGDNKQETFLNITRAVVDYPEPLFAETSPQALDFISSLLLLSASDRLSSDSCLLHPWLAGRQSLNQCSPPGPSVCADSQSRASPPLSTCPPSTADTELPVPDSDQLIVRRYCSSSEMGGVISQSTDQSASNGLAGGRSHQVSTASCYTDSLNGETSSSKVILLDKTAVLFSNGSCPSDV